MEVEDVNERVGDGRRLRGDGTKCKIRKERHGRGRRTRLRQVRRWEKGSESMTRYEVDKHPPVLLMYL